MKFGELKQLALNRIDETDYDEQIDNIVSGALNSAYLQLCKIDKRIDRAYIPIIRGICTMPDNYIGLVSCSPALQYGDRVLGKNIITSNEGVEEVLYYYTREPITDDEEEPDLAEVLQYAMVSYAVYKYYIHRKKNELAEIALNDYQQEAYRFSYENEDYDNTESLNVLENLYL